MKTKLNRLMPIEQQVANLTLSKEMCALGYPQLGIWFFRNDHFDNKCCKDVWYISEFPLTEECLGLKFDYLIAAPTVAELGIALPNDIVKRGDMYCLATCHIKQEWHLSYANLEHTTLFSSLSANTEADARAKMWIYLRKKKFI